MKMKTDGWMGGVKKGRYAKNLNILINTLSLDLRKLKMLENKCRSQALPEAHLNFKLFYT